MNLLNSSHEIITYEAVFPADIDYSGNASFTEFTFTHDESTLNEILKNALIESFKRSFDQNKIIWLIIFLASLSILGSLSNVLVLVLFWANIDCMESSAKDAVQKFRFKKNKKTKKTVYFLIQYLALVDFLTVSLS
jgi:hypothetical protein